MIKTRIEEVQLQFLTGNTELTHLKVSNDQLIVTTQRTVYRINLQDPAIVNHFDCPLSKELETIMNVHVSPMGSVILIRTNFGRYMLLKDGEFTQLNKIKKSRPQLATLDQRNHLSDGNQEDAQVVPS